MPLECYRLSLGSCVNRQCIIFLLDTPRKSRAPRQESEPQATFSPCFGAPFMALPPSRYAQLLGARIQAHNVAVWLINTGWIGGPHGEGERIKLALTRAMVRAVLSGKLNNTETQLEPIFGLHIPVAVSGTAF